jgi:hypothetical protein
MDLADNLPHIRRKVELASVSCDHVAFESLLSVKFESIQCCEDHHFVVHTLAGKPFLVRRQGYGRHTVHCGVSDVLHVDRNIPIITLLINHQPAFRNPNVIYSVS